MHLFNYLSDFVNNGDGCNIAMSDSLKSRIRVRCCEMHVVWNLILVAGDWILGAGLCSLVTVGVVAVTT